MANYTWFRPATGLTADRVRGPLAALSDGVLRGKVRVEDHGTAWTLFWQVPGPPRPGLAIHLDDEGLSWAHRAAPEDEWLLQCVACQLVRGIDPDGLLGDDADEGLSPPDFDRRYPTLASYLARPTGSRVLDAVARVAAVISKPPVGAGLEMGAAPF